MTNLLTIILTTIVSISITFLLTFFFTNISSKNITEKIAIKEVKQHVLINHKDSKTAKEYIFEHEKNCSATKELAKLKIGMIFIVGKLDGDPHEMGLM